MALIRNEGKRPLALPRRESGTERVAGVHLGPGESLDVPDWYVEALLEESGPAERMSRGELVVDEPAEAKTITIQSNPIVTPKPELTAEPGPAPADAPIKKRSRRRRGSSTGG